MKSELFTLEDRDWVANNCYKVHENNNVSFKVVDMQKLIKKIRQDRFNNGLSPQISVIPIHEDKIKSRNYSVAMYYDREHGIYYGKLLGFTSFGDPKFKRISIKESMDIDLTRDDDAELWIMLIWFPKLEGSVNEDNPYFKVFDNSKEAVKNTQKANLFQTAMGRIKSMPLKEKIYFLRFAYPAKTISATLTEEVIDGFLFEQAFANPDIFNKKYESRTRGISEIFYSGIQTGVIRDEPQQGYTFEGYKLGITELDVITYLSKDNVIMNSIIDRITKNDTALTGIVNNTNKVSENKKTVSLPPNSGSKGAKKESQEEKLPGSEKGEDAEVAEIDNKTNQSFI